MGNASGQFLLLDSLCKCSDCSPHCFSNNISNLIHIVLLGWLVLWRGGWLVRLIHSFDNQDEL